jgi:hypothetical protein
MIPKRPRRLLTWGLVLVSLGFENAPAAEPDLEIKLFVAEAKIDEAAKQIQKDFAPKPPEKHQIYFFDTPALGLYENPAGPVILRARQKGKDAPQSTVKFRRDKRDPDLEKKLGEISSEFEIQIEAIVGKKGPPGISYALDAEWGHELSKLEGASGAPISAWFSPDQKRFLETAGVAVEWANLKVFGRVDADAWDWKEKNDKRVDAKITAELWRLGDQRIYELSCKKPDKEVAKQVENFEAFFKDHNIFAAQDPPSKTKQALDYFSRRTTPQPKSTVTPAATPANH